MRNLAIVLLCCITAIVYAGDSIPLQQQQNTNNENFLYVFLNNTDGVSLPGFTIRIYNVKEGRTEPLFTDEASSVVLNGFKVDPRHGSDYVVEVYRGKSLIKQWEVHLNPGPNKIVLPMW